MMLDIGNLYYSYRNRLVLNGIDLKLDKGELLTLLGRNGAGKSTLLNCIAGLLKPQSGRIMLDGKPLQSMSARQIAKITAYVAQYPPQTYRYTMLEYAVLGCAARLGMMQKPETADYERAGRALDVLGIAHLADHIYMDASGGEKQLANIAKVLVQEPQLILFDEPTSALDYGNAAKALRLIADLSEQGYTVVMTTHNPEHPLLLHGRCPDSQTAILDDTGHLRAGNTAEIVNEENLRQLYQVDLKLVDVPGRQHKACTITGL
ncbi:ABC transporter ATP-binding protein [Neisseria elongata]|jgi:abc transporter related|uniref:ABC transporter ATP-binding protein n=1 Tax=Neisseria elongata TaxID=495 RepID=UPI001F3C0A2C|nr:ABC transporter ATP-binding protein [Neisseria elongata]